MSNENLFGQTYDQIRSAVVGGGDQYFQLLGRPKDFVFGIPSPREMSPAAYQIVSAVPNWSAIGSYATADARFFSSYGQIFQNVTWKVSPDQDAAQHDLQSTVNMRQRELDDATASVNSSYLQQKQNGGVIFQSKYPDSETWLAGPGAALWGRVVAAETAFNLAVAQLTALQKSAMPDTLQNAQEALKMPTGSPAGSETPRGWTIVKDSGGTQQWQPSYTIGKSGEDWRAELSKGTQGAFSVSLNASESTSDFAKSWAGGNAGYDAVFWGVSAGGGWQKMDLTTTDKSVTARIRVKSSTIVDVTPGEWYDGGFMRQLAKGGGSGWTINPPWVAKGGEGSKSLFGRHGLLSARVSGLVVAYQPGFEISMSEATFKQNSQKFEASAGLRIGPFHFGGHGGHESNYTKRTTGGTAFVGGSTATDPLIIGVLVAFPGVDTP